VLAPNAKLRALVVPQGPEVETPLTAAAPAEAASATEREAEPGDQKTSWDQSVCGDGPGLPGVAGATCTAEPVQGPLQGRSHQLAWARSSARRSEVGDSPRLA
jgi:hypothetical protein